MCQENSKANPFGEACLLMIPAELTDWINDVIHLSQRHSIHLLVRDFYEGFQVLPFSEIMKIRRL